MTNQPSKRLKCVSLEVSDLATEDEDDDVALDGGSGAKDETKSTSDEGEGAPIYFLNHLSMPC